MVVPGTNRLPPVVYAHHNRKQECPDVGQNGLNMVARTESPKGQKKKKKLLIEKAPFKWQH